MGRLTLLLVAVIVTSRFASTGHAESPARDPVDIRSGDLRPLVFRDPKEDPTRARRTMGAASAMPLNRGERLLMYADTDCRFCGYANSVIVVVSSPYDRARRELRATIASKIGILAEAEVTASDYNGILPLREARLPKGWPVRGLTFGQGFDQFREIGLSVNGLREYQLKSQNYNKVPELSWHSELRLRMVDGRALFGSVSSLVEIKRVDYTRQHPRYYDIPMPMVWSMTDDIVTDTEIELIREATVRLGKATARYFVPNPGGGEPEYWRALMTAIKAAAQRP